VFQQKSILESRIEPSHGIEQEQLPDLGLDETKSWCCEKAYLQVKLGESHEESIG
jgi:hypothetical protein